MHPLAAVVIAMAIGVPIGILAAPKGGALGIAFSGLLAGVISFILQLVCLCN